MAEKEGSKEGGQAYRQEKPGPKCPDFPTQPHTHRKANTRADQRRGLNEPDFGPGNRPTKKKPSSAAFVHRFFFFLPSRSGLLLCPRFSYPANWKMLLAAIYMKTVLTYHINPLGCRILDFGSRFWAATITRPLEQWKWANFLNE